MADVTLDATTLYDLLKLAQGGLNAYHASPTLTINKTTGEELLILAREGMAELKFAYEEARVMNAPQNEIDGLGKALDRAFASVATASETLWPRLKEITHAKEMGLTLEPLSLNAPDRGMRR